MPHLYLLFFVFKVVELCVDWSDLNINCSLEKIIAKRSCAGRESGYYARLSRRGAVEKGSVDRLVKLE